MNQFNAENNKAIKASIQRCLMLSIGEVGKWLEHNNRAMPVTMGDHIRLTESELGEHIEAVSLHLVTALEHFKYARFISCKSQVKKATDYCMRNGLKCINPLYTAYSLLALNADKLRDAPEAWTIAQGEAFIHNAFIKDGSIQRYHTQVDAVTAQDIEPVPSKNDMLLQQAVGIQINELSHGVAEALEQLIEENNPDVKGKDAKLSDDALKDLSSHPQLHCKLMARELISLRRLVKMISDFAGK